MRCGQAAALLLTVLALVSGRPALAGSLAVTFENDRAADTDRHYTHGSLLTWTSDKGAVPAKLRALGSKLPGLEMPPTRVSYLLGQTMFTPENIRASRLIRADRPYAGWLYGGLRLTSKQPGTRQRLELNLGVVGPPSMADWTQTVVHDAIDVQRPNGWEHQLDTEPGAVLIYERSWRPIRDIGETALETALIPQVSGAVGNVLTLAMGGARLAVGQNLDASWGPPRIYPAFRGSGYASARRELHWSLFAGLSGRAVARNIFLDGNTFSKSHSVSKNPFVATAKAGLELAYGPLRAAFTYVARTREFEGQPEPDEFASMTLSVRF